ncbi:hypothetical protein MVEN_01331800 [Mycena venus]|uniref:DUF6533 domain-containing protein n=1 Tax=Mycena venus TaxID=2733690 RepID=A0A8H7CWV0_9AGAR|nr:hypothetical protein MVEN_01331800 [Mycena venus]
MYRCHHVERGILQLFRTRISDLLSPLHPSARIDAMDDGGISTAQALRLQDELHLISITFFYLDHCLTFDDEVRYLWRKAKTRSTYYFFLNRYLAFFGDASITIFRFATVPISVCPHVNVFRQLLLVINQCLVCLLLTLRIYALYGRNIRVYIGMLGFGAVLLGISCWALIRKSGVPQPNFVGCHIDNSQKLGVYLAVPWEALVIYDVVIFLALFYKSLRTRAESPTVWWHTPLLSLLIRDGAIYFAVMALFNLGNIMTFYMAGPLLRGCLSTMASSMSVTLTSRLMLNLHSVDRTGIFSTTTGFDTSGSSPYDDSDGGLELDTLRTRDLERSGFAPPAHAAFE